MQFQSLFYCANKPYTRGLKLKLLRNENLKKTGPHYEADATKAVPEPYLKQLLHLFHGEWYCEL